MDHRPRRTRRLLALALGAAVIAAGCSSSNGGDAATGTSAPATTGTGAPGATTPPATRPPGCAADPAALGARSTHERVDVTSGGEARWYNRYVPASYDGSPVPLVIDLHGYLSGAAGGSAMSRMDTVAEREGFVLLTPQGDSDKPYWNAVPHDDLPDDVGFVADLIDEAGRTMCIDPDRVYVDGFSNGAFLASLVACRLSDRVAAVAAVAGLQDPADCAPTRPVPVLGIHGTDDGYVSFTGGPGPRLEELAWNEASRAAFEGLPWGGATAAAAAWAARNGCAPEPERTAVAPSVERITYTGCRDGATVELDVVTGAGHTWPGSEFAKASAAILGPTTSEIDGGEVVWSFFRDHPRPGAATTTGTAPTATPAAATLPTPVQTLDITGTEYTFAMTPAAGAGLGAGWTKVRFHNAGGEAHQVMFARLKDGVDLAELAAAAGGDSSGSKAIEYVDMIGGVSYIGPGQSIEALVDLPEGVVMAMCYVPDAKGVAHALSGMSTTLTVGPAVAGSASAAPGGPAEPVVGTIEMDADGYHLPDALPAGWYRVVNRDGGAAAGQGLHELSILGLEQELSDAELDRLLDALATNANPGVPLTALGGLGALSAGLEAYLYLDLEPGPYLAVDFMPDPGDPEPHLLDGYVTPFRA